MRYDDLNATAMKLAAKNQKNIDELI